MISDSKAIDESIELFIRREAANEESGSIAAQTRAGTLPRPATVGPQGQRICGHELQAATPIIDRIPDERLRRSVKTYLMITTKYQALNMLCSPQHELRQKHPEILSELIDVTTKIDRQTRGLVKRPGVD